MLHTLRWAPSYLPAERLMNKADPLLLEMKMAMMMFIVLSDAKKYKNQN